MTSLLEQLQSDVKDAMKARDPERVQCDGRAFVTLYCPQQSAQLLRIGDSSVVLRYGSNQCTPQRLGRIVLGSQRRDTVSKNPAGK